MKLLIPLCILLIYTSCSKVEETTSENSGETEDTQPTYSLSLEMQRVDQAGLDPFDVTITLKKDDTNLSGQTLSLSIPKGVASTITDNLDGTYTFRVTPSATGEYPVTVSFDNASISRTAIVLDSNIAGSGQPMMVPGDYVNTEGYEDGATITPDGEYLFVQYGPVYFSGIINFSSICNSGSYSAGYDLNNCSGRTNSGLVFNTIGPYANYQRPNFPTGNISAGNLVHLDDLVLAGVFNGIVSFPTVFYGFKRQSDGTFAEPFKLAFNDEKGVNGPFGPSFVLNGDGTAKFLIAWNNYFDGAGDGGTTAGEDDKPDIYHGTLSLGTDKNLGDVTFASNDGYSSITPYISPVGFSTHTGVQGNPHARADGSGNIIEIWTDDEQVSHNLSVYRLTGGTFPFGTWTLDTLPSDISTGAEENQPFFTGSKLYFRRGSNIVYHDYTPTNGSCGSTYTHNDCWGAEHVMIGANGNSGVGEIFTVGEPTIATYNGKTLLYFVYVVRRDNSSFTVNDYNINVGFVEI